MPVHYRAQIAVLQDSAFPRDAMVINPCFRDSGPTSNPTQLATDLANGMDSAIAGVQEVKVRLYDLEGTPPVYPAGQYVKNPSAFTATSVPRELALCLSFFSGQNRPRQRGRLYFPLSWFGGTAPALRPTQSMRDALSGQYVPLFTGLGGVDVDWGIWSTVDREFHPCTDWWIDDEWDIVRSRGLRPTTRSTGTVSE